MPIRYQREDASRRVRLTVEGAFQMDDVSAVSLRRRDDGTWAYGTLLDLRRMTEHPTVADLREVASNVIARESSEGPRGPVAILANDAAHYALACAYAALRRSTQLVEVFRVPDEAERWLTAQLNERKSR
jgi:hypothetical protein